MFGGLAIWSTAAITQILSMAGIAASTNVMVWTWGVVMGGLLIGVTYQILALLAMNKAYQENSSAANADYVTIMKMIQSDWCMGTSVSAFVGLMLYSNYNNWWAAQEEGMDEEEASALFSSFSF